MTLPQNAKDALASFDEWLDFTFAEYPAGQKCWGVVRDHLMSQEAEIERLRRALGWHEREGMTTGAVPSDYHHSVKVAREAAELAESRLAAANAQLRLMHRALSQAVCVACADDGSAKDHELDKLDGVLRDQGWITSAVVPSTPTDEHLQGVGDEA